MAAAKKWTPAARAAFAKKMAAARAKSNPGTFYAVESRKTGFIVFRSESRAEAAKRASEENKKIGGQEQYKVVPYTRNPGNAGKKSWRKTKKALHTKRTKKNPAKRRNPEGSAVAAYVDTHGKPPGKTVTVDTQKRYHSVLAGMGKLESIIFMGGPVKSIDFGKGTYLAMNEKRTQLFIVGGDQSVCLKDFGIAPVHETEVLGEVREVVYFTEKVHLIEKDGGKGPYGHKFSAPRPLLVYDTRNKLLSFAGGGYTIPSEGIAG